MHIETIKGIFNNNLILERLRHQRQEPKFRMKLTNNLGYG